MSNAESSLSGPPGYLETFSLRCEPFSERIDSRFFYAGTTLMQRLDLLTHLTQFADSLVLVSGPPGSGKTTLLSRFIGQANSQWRLCLLDAEDDFSQFPNRLADALGSGTLSSEQELLNQWADNSDGSQLLVIVIDNAEQLDESALNRLCALLGHASADRIRMILFGTHAAQTGLEQAFERNAVAGSTQRLEMPRLNEEETSSYLLYRLAVAGYSGESPFTATEIRAMCKAADGRPAMTNRLAHQALLERQERSTSKRIRPGMGRREGKGLAWVLATLGVLSVSVYIGWQRFYAASGDAHGAGGLQRPMEELPLALPEPAALRKPGQPYRAAEKPAPDIPPAVETVAEATELEVSREAREAEPSPPDAAAPADAVISKEQTIAVIPVPEKTAAADSEAQEQSLPTAPPSEQPRATEPVSPEIVEPAKPAAAAGNTTQTAAVEHEPVKESLPHRETWLLAQPENSFSLQLLGSRNEKAIADYIRRNRIDEHKAAYYRGRYRGDAWYVLMYGIYPSRQAALEERDTLPAGVRKMKPWPRSLKSVHTSIRELQ